MSRVLPTTGLRLDGVLVSKVRRSLRRAVCLAAIGQGSAPVKEGDCVL